MHCSENELNYEVKIEVMLFGTSKGLKSLKRLREPLSILKYKTTVTPKTYI